jgi:hypothetical protein
MSAKRSTYLAAKTVDDPNHLLEGELELHQARCCDGRIEIIRTVNGLALCPIAKRSLDCLVSDALGGGNMEGVLFAGIVL